MRVVRLLVTGGAGFIGSHVVDLLVEQGYRVLVADNLSTGSEGNLNAQAEFVNMDICDGLFASLVAKFKPEVVIHQAAQASLPQSLADPVHDARVNIEGTVNLLEACRFAGVQKVVYASSAAVYGEPEVLPITEDHPINAVSPYGISKYTAERYLEAYRIMYGLQYTVLRYANVYGPRQGSGGEGGVVAKFINRLQQGLVPVIFGCGKQTRDFIYVKDVAAANLAAMLSEGSQTLNVSSGLPTSVNDLFRMVAEIANHHGAANYALARSGDVMHNYLAKDKITTLFNWQPVYSLEQGLKETYHYYNNKTQGC